MLEIRLLHLIGSALVAIAVVNAFVVVVVVVVVDDVIGVIGVNDRF